MSMPTTAEKLDARLEAHPFMPFGRPLVVSHILREMSRYETIFTDYQRACVPLCEDATTCPKCAGRLIRISQILNDPAARSWEVWESDGNSTHIVGLVYLTDIIAGGDACAHFVFFDDGLKGKTHLLESMIDWCFEDHAEENWVALKRITVEVPDFAFALARYAVRKLGFGGPYTYKGVKGSAIPVEGVKKNAVPWHGTHRDMLLLGRVNGTIH